MWLIGLYVIHSPVTFPEVKYLTINEIECYNSAQHPLHSAPNKYKLISSLQIGVFPHYPYTIPLLKQIIYYMSCQYSILNTKTVQTHESNGFFF